MTIMLGLKPLLLLGLFLALALVAGYVWILLKIADREGD